MKRSVLSVMISVFLLAGAGCAGSAPAESAPDSTAPEAAPAEPAAAQPDTAVDEEGAKAIAFADAGVSEEDVTFLHVTQDKENGDDVFDIEFIAGDKEYDYEILVSSGEIRSKDAEIESAGNAEPAAAASGISSDEAKTIAFEHAGVNESDVKVTELKTETEKGVEVYNVEFIAGTMEYDYEIRVSDGAILESESEPAND